MNQYEKTSILCLLVVSFTFQSSKNLFLRIILSTWQNLVISLVLRSLVSEIHVALPRAIYSVIYLKNLSFHYLDLSLIPVFLFYLFWSYIHSAISCDVPQVYSMWIYNPSVAEALKKLKYWMPRLRTCPADFCRCALIAQLSKYRNVEVPISLWPATTFQWRWK